MPSSPSAGFPVALLVKGVAGLVQKLRFYPRYYSEFMKKPRPPAPVHNGPVTNADNRERGLTNPGRGAANPLPGKVAVTVRAIEQALDLLSRRVSEARSRIAKDGVLEQDRESRP